MDWKIIAIIIIGVLAFTVFSGCVAEEPKPTPTPTPTPGELPESIPVPEETGESEEPPELPF